MPSSAGAFLRVGHHDHVLDSGKLGQDLAYLRPAVEDLAAVEVAVGGDQHLGRDLAEAVEHAARAEIRRARGPDRAEARRCQRRDDGLRHVRQVARDPVSLADSAGRQRLGHARNLVVQLREAEAPPDTILAPENQCVRLVPRAQQVFGVVESRVGKPASARHPVAVDYDARARPVADDAREVPHGAPELRRLGDRPGVQRAVVGGFDAPTRREPRP